MLKLGFKFKIPSEKYSKQLALPKQCEEHVRSSTTLPIKKFSREIIDQKYLSLIIDHPCWLTGGTLEIACQSNAQERWGL